MPDLDTPSATDVIRAVVVAQSEQLTAFVRSRGGATVDADEIVQNAIARALEHADQLRDPARAEAWLGRVVRNVLIDELRSRQSPVLAVDELELYATDDDSTIDCGCVLVQAEELKPEYATILRRVIIDGIPVTQAARELGLTPNNATVRLHRARESLKERLKAHCNTTTVRSCSECGCEARGCCLRPAASSDRDPIGAVFPPGRP
jgi:RNA polymerase sigma-70 factor, ECF subfamily